MEFLFPDVGEGIHEGKLVSWKVKEGDAIADDQVIAEVETDKSVVEIPSPVAGTITKLHAKEGDTIQVGAPLVTFGAAGDTPPSQDAPQQAAPVAPPQPEEERPQESGTERVESTLAPKPPKPEEHEPPAAPVAEVKAPQAPSEHPARVLATPSTRRLAREKGIDIQTITGTGPNGRVTSDDIEKAAGGPVAQAPKPAVAPAQASAPEPAAAAAPAQAPAPVEQPRAAAVQPPQAGEAIAYSGRRKAIGEHMVQSHGVPTATLFAEADVTALAELRAHLKEKAEKAGAKLTYLPFFAKAACAALAKHPVLNAHFSPEAITPFTDMHLGIAADTESGLVVPVIRNADRRSVLGLAREIARLADAAKGGTLAGEEMRGSTFTISSIGPFRVDGFTSLINTPEVGILGIGGIKEKPWVVDGEIVARKIVTLALTFDHRALDGAEAARFMGDLVALVEDPELLVLEGI